MNNCCVATYLSKVNFCKNYSERKQGEHFFGTRCIYLSNYSYTNYNESLTSKLSLNELNATCNIAAQRLLTDKHFSQLIAVKM